MAVSILFPNVVCNLCSPVQSFKAFLKGFLSFLKAFVYRGTIRNIGNLLL